MYKSSLRPLYVTFNVFNFAKLCFNCPLIQGVPIKAPAPVVPCYSELLGHFLWDTPYLWCHEPAYLKGKTQDTPWKVKHSRVLTIFFLNAIVALVVTVSVVVVFNIVSSYKIIVGSGGLVIGASSSTDVFPNHNISVAKATLTNRKYVHLSVSTLVCHRNPSELRYQI